MVGECFFIVRAAQGSFLHGRTQQERTGRGVRGALLLSTKNADAIIFYYMIHQPKVLSHTQACIILLASQSLYYKKAKPQHGAVKKNEQGNSEGHVKGQS